jgi:hypothetical protein
VCEPTRAEADWLLKPDDALRCRIRVAGTIEPRLSERLGGLRLRPAAGGTMTELSGTLLDQAALLGVLNGLYLFGLPLLSVDCVADRPPRVGDDS